MMLNKQKYFTLSLLSFSASIIVACGGQKHEVPLSSVQADNQSNKSSIELVNHGDKIRSFKPSEQAEWVEVCFKETDPDMAAVLDGCVLIYKDSGVGHIFGVKQSLERQGLTGTKIARPNVHSVTAKEYQNLLATVHNRIDLTSDLFMRKSAYRPLDVGGDPHDNPAGRAEVERVVKEERARKLEDCVNNAEDKRALGHVGTALITLENPGAGIIAGYFVEREYTLILRECRRACLP